MNAQISSHLKTPATAAVTTDTPYQLQQLTELMTECQSRVEKTLESWLPADNTIPTNLHKAMRYSVMAGGKYVRPLLVYATGKVFDSKLETLDGPACAVELIHTYSLVHDDLPAMDDDDLRRGKPTCHKAFGEATAILTGDALQSLAFHILAKDTAITANAAQRLEMIDTLAVATGSQGMAGGQAIDLAAVGKSMTLEELEYMHAHKTGYLIRASVKLGALSQSQIDDRTIKYLDQFASCIGLAFQIRDDILDIEGDTCTLGKIQGADIARNKPTYPALLGMDGAKQKAIEMHEAAYSYLDPLGPQADPLRWIADYIVQRSN